ncbi:MAG TPA: hypothetical protein VMI75_38845 [Polyangiaceae bacterium]|nr:hypothetical protein [Polyangiaceae bacterium]
MRFPFPALVVPCAFAACSHPSARDHADAGAPTQAADDLNVLREASREVLDRNCGECHTSTLPTALPRALRVYDLVQLDWSRRMTDAQLRSAESRLHEPIAPTLGEGEARPVRASAEELAMFHRYVELEVQRRAGNP